jgi:hypothetical protein
VREDRRPKVRRDRTVGQVRIEVDRASNRLRTRGDRSTKVTGAEVVAGEARAESAVIDMSVVAVVATNGDELFGRSDDCRATESFDIGHIEPLNRKWMSWN